MINLTVNGEQHALDIDPAMPLLYALRNSLGLSGAKFGCGLGQCGACTVIVGDEPAMSARIITRTGEREFATKNLFETVVQRLDGFDTGSHFTF